MIGTVPADLAQFYAHVFRIMQKLMYLYGWEDLGLMDDGTKNILRAPLKTIVPQMCRQIFRQIVLKFRRHTGVCQEILVQNDGKYASR